MGTILGRALQIFGMKTGVFREAREHARAQLFAVMEGEDEVGPAFTAQCSVRARLTLDLPPKLGKSGEHTPGLG